MAARSVCGGLTNSTPIPGVAVADPSLWDRIHLNLTCFDRPAARGRAERLAMTLSRTGSYALTRAESNAQSIEGTRNGVYYTPLVDTFEQDRLRAVLLFR